MTSISTSDNMATIALRGLEKSSLAMSKAMERLSTGKRINSAGDDASGLAISKKLEAKSIGIKQSIQNTLQAKNIANIAESGLKTIEDKLHRLRELSVQVQTDLNTGTDKSFIEKEAQDILLSIDRISSETNYNNHKLLDGSFANKIIQVGADSKGSSHIHLSINEATTNTLGISNVSLKDKDTFFIDETEIVNYEIPGSDETIDFNVNSITSNDYSETGHYFYHSPLSSGGFIASGDRSPDIAYQRFNSSGASVGSKINVPDNSTDSSGTHVPGITELSNGNIAVTWQNYLNGRRQAAYKIYDSSDNLVSSGVSSQNSTKDHLNVRSVDLGNGNFGIYYDVVNNAPGQPSIKRNMRLYSNAGVAQGNEFSLITQTGNTGRSDIISLGSGKIGFVYIEQSTKNLRAYTYNTSTNSVLSNLLIDTYSSLDSVSNPGDFSTLEVIKIGTGFGVTHKKGNDFFFTQFDSSGSITKGPNSIYQGTDKILQVADIGSNRLFVAHTGSENIADTTSGKIINLDDFTDATSTKTISSKRLNNDGRLIYDNGKLLFSALDSNNRNPTVHSLTITTSGGSETSMGVKVQNTGNKINVFDKALNIISQQRAFLGTLINKLNHIENNKINIELGLNKSLMNINDANFALETARLASNQILQQSSTSMVTQATNVSKHLLQILNKE